MASGRFRKLVALFAALAIIASACGGSDGDSAATDDTGGSSAEDTSTDTDTGSEEDAEDIGADDTADGSEIESADEVEEIPVGGTLRFGMQTEAGSLNPTNTGLNRGPIMVATAIFDTLVVVDAEGQWHNNMTESWTPSDDFSSWAVSYTHLTLPTIPLV